MEIGESKYMSFSKLLVTDNWYDACIHCRQILCCHKSRYACGDTIYPAPVPPWAPKGLPCCRADTT